MMKKIIFTILILSLILIPTIFFSCDNFNLFQTNIFQTKPKTLAELLPAEINQLLLNLQRTDVQTQLIKNSKSRNELIDFLSKKITSSSGEETILARMALATLYAKTTDLRLITPALDDMVKISKGNTQLADEPKKFVEVIFGNASTSKENIDNASLSNAIRNALIMYELLNQLGENIRNNNNSFPYAYQTLSGEYAQTSVTVGSIQLLINTLDSTANTETKILLLTNYIRSSTSSTSFIATSSSFADTVLGSTRTPFGMQNIFIAANLMLFFFEKT
jgi:hypothetical protein